jgi:hypothetical protein
VTVRGALAGRVVLWTPTRYPIGTDASGTVAVPNGEAGVVIFDYVDNNTVGGSNAGEGNMIPFNEEDGVRVEEIVD